MNSRHKPRSEGSRDLRVADFVRDELAMLMQREMRDPRVGMISINDVRVSRDLSYADIYVSALTTEPVSAERREELIAVLEGAAGYFRSELAKRHTMRSTPKLRFHYDALAEAAPRMEALIDEALAADARSADRGEGRSWLGGGAVEPSTASWCSTSRPA